jgi:hypothetical protein
MHKGLDHHLENSIGDDCKKIVNSKGKARSSGGMVVSLISEKPILTYHLRSTLERQ